MTWNQLRTPLLAMLCGAVLLVFVKVALATFTVHQPAKKAATPAIPNYTHL